MSEKETKIWDLIEVEELKSYKNKSKNFIEKTGTPCRSVTFYSDKNPIEYFKEIDENEYKIDIIEKSDFWKISLTRKIKNKNYEKGYRLVEGDFIIYNDIENIWTASTTKGRDFFDHALKRFLEIFSPNISISYLSTEEMRKLFEAIDNEINGEITVDKAIVYSHQKEGSISFETRTYHEVFNDAKNQNKYLDKIKFSIDLAEKSFQGYLSRRGESRYISGPEPIYYDYILQSLAKLICDKGQLFTNKSREFGSKESNPIEIVFKESAIKGPEDNLKVIRALKQVKSSSITVYHKNPYLHTSIMDFTDGSSADVFITSDRSISIIPSFNSSRNSLMKICDNITKEFQEGEIIEGKRNTQKSFDSFFT